ncbi:MAG: nicotinate (nicotinamide) nucleotide adenylyltransferase [Candidatus Mcinerneyibacterium aminivorans]|uniref:Probable nicotinate-nucleotide adenylyltransferase n=1 Tax=Candidatus Mcinerneyibacterium aminivorans TaxID=2703815 RepID=A0A5D0MJB9_9BACT|nr:MAG: nicotinate (nicotinamide) nucleotide adenylyltransferase [Candidatus Mcinerneyibacterium aminivorans]
MRIGLFGGSFNPVHNAHYFIAEEALNQLDLDLMYFVPAYKQPFKIDEKMLTSQERLKLISSSNKNKKIKISRFEIDKKTISYTYETVNYFKNKGKLYLIIGSDSAFFFNKWKKYRSILDNVEKIVVFPRLGFPKNKILDKWDYKEDKLQFLNSPILEISSTEIRKRIRNNDPFRYLIPKEVYEIITKKGYYK